MRIQRLNRKRLAASLGVIGLCVGIVLAAFKIAERTTKSVMPTVSAANQPSIPEKVDMQATEIKNLKEELKEVKESLSWLYGGLETDPNFVLRQIDRNLDLLAQDEQDEIHGSYSDWFVPKIKDLQGMGVPKSLLQKRINRVIDLAGNGKYYSSSIKEIVEREGFYKFRSSALAILK